MYQRNKAFFKLCLFCGVLGSGIAVCLGGAGVNVFDLDQMVLLRTCMIFATLIYLLAVLFSFGSKYELAAIILIPFLTQYYQTVLGRDFPPGVLSGMRVLPLIVMAMVCFIFSLKRGVKVSNEEFIILSFWVLSIGPTIFNEPGITPTALANIAMLLFILPFYYFYLSSVLASNIKSAELVLDSLTLGLILLQVGSIIVISLGFDLTLAGKSDLSIVYLRSLSDGNVIFIYLILLWPLVFGHLQNSSFFLILFLMILCIIVSFLGLSRMAILIVPLIFGLSTTVYLRKKTRTIMVVLGVICLAMSFLMLLPYFEQLQEALYRRLNIDYSSSLVDLFTHLIASIDVGSSAFDSRQDLHYDALELFKNAPMWGHGWGSFLSLSSSGHPSAHGMVLDWLAETGLWGTSGLFVIITIAVCNLIAILRKANIDFTFRILFVCCFMLWLIVVNFFGGNLQTLSEQGFTANAVSGFILVCYLRKDLLEYSVAKR